MKLVTLLVISGLLVCFSDGAPQQTEYDAEKMMAAFQRELNSLRQDLEAEQTINAEVRRQVEDKEKEFRNQLGEIRGELAELRRQFEDKEVDFTKQMRKIREELADLRRALN